MASYRFCRTDDVPLLVRAHNDCFAPHVPELAPLTVADFRRGSVELNLWASSCMLAAAGKEPIAVLLAAKRPAETLIWRLGVHPQHLRPATRITCSNR